MIQIRSEAPRYRVSISSLERRVRKILKALGLKKTGLSVLLTTDAKIRAINRQYLNHDRPTDVISFGNSERTNERKRERTKKPEWKSKNRSFVHSFFRSFEHL